MGESKLADAYRRYLPSTALAEGSEPVAIEVCEITEPLCNDYIKLRNYYMALPYNFMMTQAQWLEVKNSIELLTALRFGMEYDMNKYGQIHLLDPAFHTQMYLKFHDYLMRNAMRDATKIVAEFQQATFKARFMTTYAIDKVAGLVNEKPTKQIKEAIKNAKALKNQIDSINVVKAATDMAAINLNSGPLTINRKMFIKVFHQDFNPLMIDIMRQERTYRGDPKNVQEDRLENPNFYR